jgi:hypothetical protein
MNAVPMTSRLFLSLDAITPLIWDVLLCELTPSEQENVPESLKSEVVILAESRLRGRVELDALNSASFTTAVRDEVLAAIYLTIERWRTSLQGRIPSWRLGESSDAAWWEATA